ncbi:hypothetical protein [Paenibacillus assamensis]|uniref:hypothetical protein n=1 Tax=Paenibacillus assamensis TaxID=311244 RepID=UPI00040DB010|nr:hypothetical protein [Paenibacillus assamensis]
MKKWIITVFAASIVVVSGCGAENNQKKGDGENPQTVVEQKKNQEMEQPKVNLEDIVYTPIDESKYEGMELEMIKLVNLYAKYVNTRDENKFKQIHRDSHFKLPNFKVSDMKVIEFHHMKPTQGYVSVEMTRARFESREIETDRPNFFIAQNKETKQWYIVDLD